MVSLLIKLVDLDHSSQLDLVQKAKIQWSIEGDKNLGYLERAEGVFTYRIGGS